VSRVLFRAKDEKTDTIIGHGESPISQMNHPSQPTVDSSVASFVPKAPIDEATRDPARSQREDHSDPKSETDGESS